MSSRVITIEPAQSLTEARTLLHRHRIRQLPVLSKNRLVGIITDRDLRAAETKDSTVADRMTPKPVVIGPNASVDEAARMLTAHKIGALPVVEDSRLVGILSSSDVLDAFVDLSGVGEPTYRLVVSGAKGKQAERQVRQVVADVHGELKWLHPDSRQAGKLHLRVKARRIDEIVDKIEAAGFEVDALIAPSPARSA